MNAQELTLNIAVNLGRIGRWAGEGRRNRVNQLVWMKQNYIFISLNLYQNHRGFQKTFAAFIKTFDSLRSDMSFRHWPGRK